MNLGRWIERIYTEGDFGRNLATSVAGVVGLLTYLQLNDGVTAAFAAIIVVRLRADGAAYRSVLAWSSP